MTVSTSADEFLSSLLSLAPSHIGSSLRNPSIAAPLHSLLLSQTTPLTSFPAAPQPSSDRTRALLHSLVAHLSAHRSTLSPAFLSLYACAYGPTNHSLVAQTVESAFATDPFLLADASAHGPPACVTALEHRGKVAASSTASGSPADRLAIYLRKIQPHLALATSCDTLSEAYGRFDGGVVFGALARAYEEVLPAFAPATLTHLAPSQAPASTSDVLAYLHVRLALLQTAFTLLDTAFLKALPKQNGPAARAALSSELSRALRPLLDADSKPGEVGLVNASLVSDLERFFGLRRRLEEAGGAGVEVRDRLGKVGQKGVANWDGVQLLRGAAQKAGRKTGGKGKERETTQQSSAQTELNPNVSAPHGSSVRKRVRPADPVRAATRPLSATQALAALALPTSAILDIFPHLSTPYVHSLLVHPQFSHAANPSERVMEALLEGKLPSGLEEDRGAFISSDAPAPAATTTARAASPPPFRVPTPPPQAAPAPRRANVFDDVRLDANKMRRGKDTATVDALLVDRSYLTEDVKAAIIARAERESSDDDDDDDYGDAFEDEDDAQPRIRLGGRDGEEEEEGHGTHTNVSGAATPTTATDPSAGALANPITPRIAKRLEELLIADPSLFERNSGARKGKGRAKLREETGLADEQIEGWKIMLDRNVSARDGSAFLRSNVPTNAFRSSFFSLSQPNKAKILTKHELVNSFKGNHALPDASSQPSANSNHTGEGGAGRGRGGGRGAGQQQGPSRGGRGGSEGGGRGARGGAARGRGDGGRAQHERRQRGADKKARAMGAI